jgi:chromosome partitioning protein
MIIVVANQKGGVSKTTTAVSVASRLASDGDEVLLLDFDQQGHCAVALGKDPEPGVFGWLVADQGFYNARRFTGRNSLELLPGDSKTKIVELVYRGESDPHQRIQQHIRAYLSDYHHMVIDTAAAGLLQESAIGLADVLLVPVRLEHLGVDGLHATLALRDRLNPGCRVIVVPTQFDARLGEHKYNLGVLQDAVGEWEMAPPVPARVAVSEAVAVGQTIWEYNGRGVADVRAAYDALVEMLVGEGE